jgi:hypothetical protein
MTITEHANLYNALSLMQQARWFVSNALQSDPTWEAESDTLLRNIDKAVKELATALKKNNGPAKDWHDEAVEEDRPRGSRAMFDTWEEYQDYWRDIHD